MDPLQLIINAVRAFMARLAKVLNNVSKGAIKPVHITILSFLGHIPAAWALWQCRPILAAGLITVFGLMDSLDGALAREQKTVSRLGTFFDAVTDRMKEALLYSALVVFTSEHVAGVAPWLVVAAAGTSLLVSYVKAKGEAVLVGTETDVQKLNRMFDGGLARYEVRMAMLVIGLLTGYLAPLLKLMVALNMITAAIRFMQVSQLLADQDAHLATENKKKKMSKK